MNNKRGSITQKIFVIIALVVFVTSLIIAYCNTFEVDGLFYTSNGYVDSKYYQELSPIGTAFSIVWPIIYFWNGAAIVYIAVSMFLPEHKSPVNIRPTLVTVPFLVFHSLGFGATVGWLFAFDAEILSLSLCCLITSAVSLYIAVGISYKRVHDNLEQLDTTENRAMLRTVRILIQNGLCLPATWLTIACCLNTTDVIVYEDSFGMEAVTRGTISVEDASTVILSVLFAGIISWFLLDNFVLEKYTRYTFTVFPVLILGLSGLVEKLRRDQANRNLTYASVVLGCTVVAFIFRVVYFVIRRNRRLKLQPEEKVDNIIENGHTEVKL